MKKAFLFLLVICATVISTQAQTQEKKQSLKDLLYSGKLKMDSNTVVRKGDDLSTKVDTSTKKPVEPEKQKPAVASVDSASKNPTTASEPAAVTSAPATAETAAANEEAPATATASTPTPVKSNTKILKEYSDSLLSTLKTEVLSSKKIKKETYYLIADYEIDTNGQVSITNVSSTPENSFLQEQVKERMSSAPPQLAPAVDGSGKARKVKRKYSFSITKD